MAPPPSLTLVTLTLILMLLSFPLHSLSSPSFSDLLSSYSLPSGLFPPLLTSFSFSPSTGFFSLSLPASCNVKFESSLHYNLSITGTLNFSSIGDLSGVSAQELFLWLPVEKISVDVPSSGLISFDVGGGVLKQYSLSLFETAPDCVDAGPIEINHAIVENYSKWEDRWSNIQQKSNQGTKQLAAS